MGEEHRYRTERFGMRLFPEEMRILKKKAEEQGVSKTDYVRDLILFGCVKETRRSVLSDEKFLKMLYEMNRIGNNINQIAYNSNLKKSTGKEGIKALSESYDSLLQLYNDTFMYPETESEKKDHGNNEEPSDNQDA